MPYIIRDTSKGPNAPTWDAFRARAQKEGHSLAWVIWQLIRRYVDRGLD